MDSIFGRKKRSRQLTGGDPAEKSIPYERTVSGRNPIPVETIGASASASSSSSSSNSNSNSNSNSSSRLQIGAPAGNPTLGSGSRVSGYVSLPPLPSSSPRFTS